MFLDRAEQFRNRLGWNVAVNELGEERDRYDDLNPLYVIWQNEDGTHGGSMRSLPTTGRTMTNEHFTHLTDGVHIRSPLIWEVTRFCLAPGAHPGVAAALMLAGAEFSLRFGIDQVLGVFDARMVRIYKRIGFAPDVLGTEGGGREAISIGLWTFTEEARAAISRRSGIPETAAARWFDAAFHPAPAAAAAERAPASETRASAPAFGPRASAPAFESRASAPAFESRASAPAFAPRASAPAFEARASAPAADCAAA